MRSEGQSIRRLPISAINGGPRRRRGAQEKPPGILRPRNIPAQWSGAVTPSMRGEGRGTFFQIFWFPLGTPFPFFWTPRCAPRGKPSLFRRRPQPPICLRTSRGRGVPPIAPGTTSRASSSCFAGKPFTVTSRYRPTGLCLRSGQEQPDRRAQLRRLGSYRLPFWQQSLLVRLARDR